MNTRYKRQSFLGQSSEEILSGLRIAIVGLGGGGSHISQQLAHAGIGNFMLFDPDKIEESNLNRLIGGTLSDVQKEEEKVQIARRTILSINPSAKVIPINKNWQDHANQLRDCDVVFGCVDTFAGRNDLEKSARRYMIPYIDIGMDVHEANSHYFIAGQVALSMPGDVCLHCMNVLRSDLLAQEANEYGAAGGRPQVVWPNGVLASMAVGIMMQLFTPWHEDHNPPCLLEYDGNLQEVHVSSSAPFLLQKNCPHFVSVSDLGDPWFEELEDPHKPRKIDSPCRS